MFKSLSSRFFILIVLFALLESCCSKGTNSLSKVVKINLGSEPHTLDPRIARDASSLTLMWMFFEGLVRINPEDRPELALASHVEISKDLKTYTFTLRSSKWSNGDPLLASDFVYAYTQVLSPSFSSDNAFQLFILKNGKAIKEGKLPVEALGVKAPNASTLVIELEQPIPYFLELLAFPTFFPINAKVDKEKSNWSQNEKLYVCNGPFTLKKWRHQDCIIGCKNPTYWDAPTVKLDEIEMVMISEDAELKLFEKKELQWAGSPLSVIQLDALPMLKKEEKLHLKPIARTVFLRVNIDNKSLSNLMLRKSLALAIDRNAIVEHILQGGGLPSLSLVPPQLFPVQETKSPTDIETASQYFREYLDASNGAMPQIVLTYCASEMRHLIAQALQEQWKKVLGIDVVLEGVEKKVYFSRISHQDYQLAIGDWIADYNDPLSFLEVFKFKTQSTNNTNWEDQAYVQLLNCANDLPNGVDRLQLLKKCEEILLSAMPIIPLYHANMVYVKDEHLQGVFLSSLGHLDFKWASMDNSN